MLAISQQMYNSLYKTCFQYCRNKEDAADCLQEALIKGLQSEKFLKEKEKLTGWLRIIVRNYCVDQYRKKKNDPNFVSVDFVSNSAEIEEPVFLTKSDYGHMQREISNLSKAYRETFLLRNAGLSYQEIANKLGVSIGTSKSNCFKARKKLSKQLIYLKKHLYN